MAQPQGQPQPGNQVPKRAARLAYQWRWLHRAWWAVHYGVGLLGVAGGVVAAGTGSELLRQSSEVGGAVTAGAGLIAAVCTSLVTFLGPLNKAQRYWTAFHDLDHALLVYEERLIDTQALCDQIREARYVVVGGVDDPTLRKRAPLELSATTSEQA